MATQLAARRLDTSPCSLRQIDRPCHRHEVRVFRRPVVVPCWMPHASLCSAWAKKSIARGRSDRTSI